MNTFMKIALVSSAVLLLASGCAATSTYKNYSTPSGNRVEATGQAAIAAGASHSSHNCINCGTGTYPNYGSGYSKSYGEDSVSQITKSATSAASSAISSVVYQSIYGAIR